MAIPTIYINLEDDVSKIVTRIKKQKSQEVVLVCPKRSFIFNDSINLRLLKKQVDLIGVQTWILTMDLKGQLYAKEAGFGLKFLPKITASKGFSDVKLNKFNKEKNNFTKTKNNTEPETQYLEKQIHEKNENTNPDKKTKARILQNIMVSEHELTNDPHLQNFKNKFKQSKLKYLIVFPILILAILISTLLFVLPRAEIVIFPKTENITRGMEITAGINIPNSDALKLVVPAKRFSETLELTDKFQSQGKKEVGNKSSGMVNIYNFTSSPLNLKANTTVLQVGGKIYKLSQDALQIKPTLYKNSSTKEVDESTLVGPFEVVAEQGGESYNLPASTRLEVTNQVFGSRPQLLYAKAFTAISGGTSRYLSLVSDTDLVTSQKALMEKAIKQINSKFSSESLVVLENAFKSEILEFKTDKPAGSESPSFEAIIKTKISGILVNENEINNMVYERISQTLSNNKTLSKKTGIIKIQSVKPDFDSGLLLITIHYQGDLVYKVDLTDIKSKLTSKKPENANEIITKNNEIGKIDIVLSPKWQKNLPILENNIKISVSEEPF